MFKKSTEPERWSKTQKYQMVSGVTAASVGPGVVLAGLTTDAEFFALVDVVARPVVGRQHETIPKSFQSYKNEWQVLRL
jgi:hypothetical protein